MILMQSKYQKKVSKNKCICLLLELKRKFLCSVLYDYKMNSHLLDRRKSWNLKEVAENQKLMFCTKENEKSFHKYVAICITDDISNNNQKSCKAT